MSKVPAGWGNYSVGELFDVQLGKMLNQPAKQKQPQYRYLGNSNVKWGRFEFSNLNTMHFSEKEIEKFTLNEGDILMCEGGEVGRCAIWRGNDEVIFYQKALHRLRSKGKINPEFFQNIMQNIAGTKHLDDFSTRTSIAHLTREKLLKLKVNVPPLPEQTKIAQILSTWDKAIATIEKLIGNSQQQKKALMQSLLTGKKRLTGFEGEFKYLNFSDVVGIDQQNLKNKTADDFSFKYISLTDVKFGVIEKSLEYISFKNAPSRARRILKEGDILLATVRPNLQGFARVKKEHGEMIASTGFSVLSPKKSFCSDYIFHYLYSDHLTAQIDSLVVGSNYPAINSSDVANLKIFCPEYNEQVEIAKVLNNCLDTIENMQKKLAFLKQEKAALMQQLLTGKRRVKVEAA